MQIGDGLFHRTSQSAGPRQGGLRACPRQGPWVPGHCGLLPGPVTWALTQWSVSVLISLSSGMPNHSASIQVCPRTQAPLLAPGHNSMWA